VVVVINSGRLKEKSYDPYTNVSTLMSAWISRASERQRRGRAGRCQPGVCFHLYSRQRSEALADFQLPELRRSPLDEMCLQAGLAAPRSPAERTACC
jgi:HrpA-like RNA helicase